MTDEEREKSRDAFMLIITFPLRLIGWIFWLILFIPRKIYTIIRSPKCIIILPILAALCYYRKEIVAMASPNAWEWLSSIYLWGGIAGIIAIRLIFKEDRRLFYKKENNMGLIQSYRQFRLARIMSLFGNITASRQLGDCFFYGHGVERDFKKAEKYYISSIKAGSVYLKIRAVEFMHEINEAHFRKAEWHSFFDMIVFVGGGGRPDYTNMESAIESYALDGNDYAIYALIKMFRDANQGHLMHDFNSASIVAEKKEKWLDLALKLKSPKALSFHYRMMHSCGDNETLAKIEKLADKGIYDAVDYMRRIDFSEKLEGKYKKKYEHFIKKFKSQDEKNRLAHEAIFAKVPPKFKNKIEGVDDENRISFRAIYEKDFPRFQS